MLLHAERHPFELFEVKFFLQC